jgi:hypothetical protein
VRRWAALTWHRTFWPGSVNDRRPSPLARPVSASRRRPTRGARARVRDRSRTCDNLRGWQDGSACNAGPRQKKSETRERSRSVEEKARGGARSALPRCPNCEQKMSHGTLFTTLTERTGGLEGYIYPGEKGWEGKKKHPTCRSLRLTKSPVRDGRRPCGCRSTAGVVVLCLVSPQRGP